MSTLRTPTPFQHAVLTVPEEFNLFLGGGRGGGKSTAVQMLVTRAVHEQGEHCRALIVRETLRALEEIVNELDAIFTATFPGTQLNRSEKIFRLPNGATVECGQCDSAEALKKYVGRSYTVLIAEEFGAMKTAKYINQLRANLRTGAPGIKLRTILTANPGGALHTYCHRNFIARTLPFDPFDLDGERWVHAPSTYRANPHVNAMDYERKLRAACSGDEALLKAWCEGDWNIARGAFFADVIDQSVHQLPVAWPYPINPKMWLPFIAHDYGSGAPSVTYLCLQAPGDVGPFAKSSLILADELALVDPTDDNVGLNYPPAKMVEGIQEMWYRWGLRGTNITGCADDYKGLEQSLLQVFLQHHLHLIRPTKARVAGWARMREMAFNAKEKNGRPGLYVSARCGYFWRTVPFLQRDPHRPEDIMTDGPDHGADAARYACMHLGQYGVGFGRTIGNY
jgi:hypothetical protein